MTSMITATLPPTLPALDNTIGAYFLGTLLGMLLYGVLTFQVSEYFRLYPRDRSVHQGLVAAVLFLETLFGILNMHTCYYYLVTSYFAPERLLTGVWSLNVSPLASALTVVIAQSFFARRVYLFDSRCRFVAAIATILFSAEIVLDTVASVQAFMLKEFSKSGEITVLATAGSISASVADLLLTAVLVLALRRSRTGFKRTDSLIAVITMYTINTGLLTGILHVLLWILSLRYPTNLIYAGVGVVNTRLYANVLLATLNARISFSKRGMHTFGLVTDFTEFSAEVQTGRFHFDDPAAAPRGTIELRPWDVHQNAIEPNDGNGVPDMSSKVNGDVMHDKSDENAT